MSKDLKICCLVQGGAGTPFCPLLSNLLGLVFLLAYLDPPNVAMRVTGTQPQL